MSLIADPWNDQEVEINELEGRMRNIRTSSHRTHSQWNDSSMGQARPTCGPVEIQPSVRIMQRDQPTNRVIQKPDNSAERIDKTLEEREKAYAEARRRILGDNSDEGDQSGKFGDQSQTKRFQEGGFDKGRGNGDRGRRGGRARNNGRQRPGNRENNYEHKEEEKSRTNTRTNPPRGYKNRSNGNRGRGGYRSNQDQDRT